jgi:D-serine deaminase-like pyridoxal phosphate-dependent protein
MDGDYGSLEWSGMRRPRQSLYIASTIMSATHPGRAVCDAGLKGVAVDSGLPKRVAWLADRAEAPLDYIAANDEHGVMAVRDREGEGGRAGALLGERVLLVPGHCDPTANLYDEYVCFRGERVETLWPIDARGLSR